MEKVNFLEKFDLIREYWSPKIVGELNDSYIKLAKLKGEFVWHSHKHEDELFFVVKGKLQIKLKEKEVTLNEGEFFIIPKGVEHLPVAEDEVYVVLMEPKTTINTGNLRNEKTINDLEWI